jgi:ribosome-binding factor A
MSDKHDGAAFSRSERIEHLILDELQSLIRDEAADPALEPVRLLKVQLSLDGGHARIAYVVTGAPSDEHALQHRAEAGLKRASGFFRARLARLELKKLPKLSFTFVGVTEGGEP